MYKTFYQTLKKFQLNDESNGLQTHRGMDLTSGRCNFIDYDTSPTMREFVFKKIEYLHNIERPFALMENIYYLSDGTLTRFRVDLDVDLSTWHRAAFAPYVEAFINTLYDVLYEYTQLSLDDDVAGMIILREKPAPTARSDGNSFKHGAKLTMNNFVSTHAQMLQVRQLLLERHNEWMPASWRGDTPPEDTKIIDPVVYTDNGWLMYGSQKEKQVRGGYTDTYVWTKKGEVGPVINHEGTFGTLLRMLSIFPDPDNPRVEQLQWTKEPPLLTTKVPEKRKRVAELSSSAHQPRSKITEPLKAVLLQILKGHVGDTTSYLTHELSDGGIHKYYVNRTRKSLCAKGQEHDNNRGLLILNTDRDNRVKYICMSDRCEGSTVIPCPTLAAQWAALEGSRNKKAKTDTGNTQYYDDGGDDYMPDFDDELLQQQYDNDVEIPYFDDELLQQQCDDDVQIPYFDDELQQLQQQYDDDIDIQMPDFDDLQQQYDDDFDVEMPDFDDLQQQYDDDGCFPDLAAEPVSTTAIVERNPPRTERGYTQSLLGIINKHVSVCIAMNGGKSFAAIELAKFHSTWIVWFITARQSHAYALLETMMQAELQCTMYLDKEKFVEDVMSRIKIVQYQSIAALLKKAPTCDLLILDETKSLAGAICCTSTNGANLMENWCFLQQSSMSAQKVLFLDADQTHDGAAYALQDMLYKHYMDKTAEYLAQQAEDERARQFIFGAKETPAATALSNWYAQPRDKILRREYPVSKWDMQRKLKPASGAMLREVMKEDLITSRRILVVCGSVNEVYAWAEWAKITPQVQLACSLVRVATSHRLDT
jgi:hypothetical protein